LGDALKLRLLQAFADAKALASRARTAVQTPSRMPHLIQHQTDLGLPQEVPVNLSKIRFLSLGEATIVLLRQLPAIILTLQDVIDGSTDKTAVTNAKALQTRLKATPFLICLCIESVCVNVLKLSNLHFQSLQRDNGDYLPSFLNSN
jgi:hypothetical protein